MHLIQPESMYSVCGRFTKNKERIQKFKKPEGSQYINQNKPDKACFKHDLAYRDFNDFRRMASDKVLRDKTFKPFKNPKYDGYQCRLASFVYKFLEKKETSGGAIKSEIMIFLICN